MIEMRDGIHICIPLELHGTPCSVDRTGSLSPVASNGNRVRTINGDIAGNFKIGNIAGVDSRCQCPDAVHDNRSIPTDGGIIGGDILID